MLSVSLVNLFQVSLLTTSVVGLVLLRPERKYKHVGILFALVSVSSIFNLLEELNVTKDIYLVTPIFVLGFGPSIYLAISAILGKKIVLKDYFHFLPMFLAIPFTNTPEFVILAGTCSRVIYGIVILKKLYKFRRAVVLWRSDAFELSFRWLFGWVAIMSLVSILNLLRLNFQIELGYSLNVLGQGVSTFISLLFLIVLLHQLVVNKSSIISLINDSQHSGSEKADYQYDDRKKAPKESDDTELTLECISAESTSNQFASIYDYLTEQILQHQWFKTQRLTLSNLAERTGLQTRDISRAINIHAKINFNEFINRYRIEYVVEQIKQTPEISLLTLAIDAGFSSKTTFNNAFKQIYGMTPSDFKRKNSRNEAASLEIPSTEKQ